MGGKASAAGPSTGFLGFSGFSAGQPPRRRSIRTRPEALRRKNREGFMEKPLLFCGVKARASINVAEEDTASEVYLTGRKGGSKYLHLTRTSYAIMEKLSEKNQVNFSKVRSF